MSTPDSFGDIRDRLNLGEPEAVGQVFERYASRLVELARKNLDERLRKRVDPEEIIQSVFRSFCRRAHDRPFQFEDWNGLWGLLVRITRRKCLAAAERHFAGCRDVRRESAPLAGESDSGWNPPGDEPTPEEAVVLVELVEQVMQELGTDIRRKVFELSLQGYDVAEISQQTGYYERGVYRTREDARAILTRELEELGS